MYPFRPWCPWGCVAAFVGMIILSPVVPAQDSSTTAFGTLQQTSESALVGIFYDFKQDPQRKPTGVSPERYPKILAQFLQAGWHEHALAGYFRAPRPIYATQIYVPWMNADQAPRAFGVEKLVQPSRWIIHYKGQVLPPENGTYRFVGYSDDLIMVRVNEQEVLVATHSQSAVEGYSWKPTGDAGKNLPDSNLRTGSWFEARTDKPIDLDVIVGERPGGQFSAYLLIEKQGVAYKTNSRGLPLLPLFRLADDPPPKKLSRNDPDFMPGGPIWKGVQ
jgi:hypothetical protein